MVLWLASVAAITLGLRSVLIAPIPLEIAVIAALGYAALVATGIFVPAMQMFGDTVCRGPKVGRRVALTFDDGPDPVTTPLILEQLRAAGVRATFFVIGTKAQCHPELLRTIAEEGHELAVHGHSHTWLYAFLSPRRVEADVRRALDVVERTLGVRPKWFRPPIGMASPRTFAGARRAGVTVVGWSIRALDGVGRTKPEAVVARVLSRLEPGAIVLLHDASESGARVPASVGALPSILRAAAERKLDPVRLDALLESTPD